MSGAAWSQKGGTLSDKSARKEFGLTQEEIERATRAGKLQYRRQSVYGNPFLRLLRKEVETLGGGNHGARGGNGGCCDNRVLSTFSINPVLIDGSATAALPGGRRSTVRSTRCAHARRRVTRQ